MNIIEKKRQAGQAGFTLTELLVVVAILAIVAGLAVIGLGAMRSNATRQACKADVDTYQTAIEAYNVDNNSWPTGATAAAINAGSGGSLIQRVSKNESAINGAYSSVTGQITTGTACP